MAALSCVGCVERTLTVTSTPPHALVVLNDQEVGRTPFRKRLIWYGTYEVQVRRDGYETLNTQTPIIAPWWQWVPFDLFAEVFPVPLQDNHAVAYTLRPLTHAQVDPRSIVARGERLRDELQSSQVRPKATTRPSGQSTER